MREVLLQTIVEKLEALEISSLKEINAGKDGEKQNELTQEIKSLKTEL